jgi:hypothetical protein
MKKMSRLRTYYGRELGKEKASRSSGRGGNEVYNIVNGHFSTCYIF